MYRQSTNSSAEQRRWRQCTEISLCSISKQSVTTLPSCFTKQTITFELSVLLATISTLRVKKTAPFTFEHNFRKYWPILRILSLLQTEIICPNSPDLNPLDYEIWTVMQRLVYQRQSIMRMNWNGGSSMSGAVLKNRFLTRLLTSGEEDFKRMFVLKENTSRTACQLIM